MFRETEGNPFFVTEVVRLLASDRRLENALFTLNPGLQIELILDAQGNTLAYAFANGLLEIPISTELGAGLNAGAQTAIQLQFHGEPNLLFGYLDSAIEEWSRITGRPLALVARHGAQHASLVVVASGSG